MTQLIIVEPTGNEQRVTLSRDEYILGRDPTVSIPLRDRKVSRQHARIFRKGASYLIEDLGSVNGVLADGAAIQGAKKLVPGIEFDVGGFLLSVLPENLDAELTFTFTGRTPPFSGQEFLLPQGELEVGRVDGNAIVIPDTSVSRQHAAVLVGSSVVEVRDNGSSNGTFVNGERIVNRTLAGGDVVAFGNVEFDFSVSGDEAGAFPQLSALLGGKTAGQLAVVLAGATVVVLVGVLLYLLWPSGSDDQVLVSEQELRFERNLDSTLKRAEETFERAEWSEARTLFDEVLRDDPIHVRRFPQRASESNQGSSQT
ncbi:MAG: FHA domain-containing protein, partial [Myxococcota bacterium]